MAVRRYVDTSFWHDPYIAELDTTEKCLFLYFLTNPATNLIGVYELHLRYICLDTGIDKDLVLKLIERFSAAGKIDYVEGWVVVHNFAKHQNMKSPDIMTGMKRLVSVVPQKIWVRLMNPNDTLYTPSLHGLLTDHTSTDIPNLTLPYSTLPNGGEPPTAGLKQTSSGDRLQTSSYSKNLAKAKRMRGLE